LAFVSGSYDRVDENKSLIFEVVNDVCSDHYMHLLKTNYIGMHGTVLYQRWVFNEFLYDVSLKACEDYDLYLKVASKYPVKHHTRKIAAYRIHGANMSNAIPLMLSQSLLVLTRQLPLLTSKEEKQAYQEGVNWWKQYYTLILYNSLRSGDLKISKEYSQLLLKHNFQLYIRYMLISIFKKNQA
jgi:hypothetical protein